MVNLAAYLPSVMAWERIGRAFSRTIGSTRTTESHKAWVYRPKRHVEFTDRNARLEDVKPASQKFPVAWIPCPVGH